MPPRITFFPEPSIEPFSVVRGPDCPWIDNTTHACSPSSQSTVMARVSVLEARGASGQPSSTTIQKDCFPGARQVLDLPMALLYS
jgi:hypothetical protein